MGIQHGAPAYRIVNGLKYSLYKEYDPMFGETEQKIDATKLKSDGWKIKSITTKKGRFRIIERSLYIRRP
jgi:hypothetical protein